MFGFESVKRERRQCQCVVAHWERKEHKREFTCILLPALATYHSPVYNRETRSKVGLKSIQGLQP